MQYDENAVQRIEDEIQTHGKDPKTWERLLTRKDTQLILTSQLLALAGCVQRNMEGRMALRSIPPQILEAQASTAYKDQKKKNKISNNSKQASTVSRVTKRMIHQAKVHYPDQTRTFKWETVLFDNQKTVNAWAMPGGKMAVYSGILPICSNEAGLAAVIGHEMGHIMNHHGNERVSQQLGVAALTALGAYAFNQKSKLDSDIQKAIIAAVGAGISIGLLLPYSRKHEHEADRMGMRLMAMAGYQPSEAPKIWQRMEQKFGKSKVPSYLSTHPSNTDRRSKLNSQVPEMEQFYKKAPGQYGAGNSFV